MISESFGDGEQLEEDEESESESILLDRVYATGLK